MFGFIDNFPNCKVIFLLSMFNYMLYLTESSNYRAGHTDGTTACCSLS